MIVYAPDHRKQEVINLWKTAFPADSEAFVAFYFERKYLKKNTLLYLKNEKTASCLQMLPYEMTYYEHVIRTSYISGAATLPEYRNQGLMGNLLLRAFVEMKKRKHVLTTLIPQEPWLTDFYKKFGYTPCFEQELTAVNANDYPHFPDRMRFKALELADFKNAYNFYKNYFAKQNLCIQKSFSDFSVMVAACQLFEGDVYLLINKGETVGLCFCFFADGKVVLKDCITRDADYEQYFFSKLTRKFGNQAIFLCSPKSSPSLIPSKEGNSSPAGAMARILDAPKLLTLFAQAQPQLQFSIKIADPCIWENNCTFAVSNGKITKIASQTVDFEVSIEELTQLLLGYQMALSGDKYTIFPLQHPYMSLMLE